MGLAPEQILADLVVIPSVTGDWGANEAALDYVENHLVGLGMHVERPTYAETIGDRPTADYGVLIATTTTTKMPKVMLSAHVDVVPGPPELFKLRQQGDKLYGRGVADMKGQLAAFLACASRLKEEVRLSEYDFGITIVTNEEIGGRGVENTLKDGFLPEVVVLPDNGKDWQMERVAKGAWTIVAEATGISAHGSRPWDGDSATFRLLDFLSDVRPLFKDQGLETDTLNISHLDGGHAQNQVPAIASATLDIRVMSQESQERLQTAIEALCERHRVSYRPIAYFRPLEHDMNNPYIRMFRESLQAVRGVDAGETISPGACDAGYYDQRNIPTIVVQPTAGGEHADGEWLDRRSFRQLIDVIEHFLKQTCRTGRVV